MGKTEVSTPPSHKKLKQARLPFAPVNKQGENGVAECGSTTSLRSGSGFHFDADPDPTFHSDVDPDGYDSSSKLCESATSGLQTIVSSRVRASEAPL